MDGSGSSRSASLLANDNLEFGGTLNREIDEWVSTWIRYQLACLMDEGAIEDHPDFEAAVMNLGRVISTDAAFGLQFVARAIQQIDKEELLSVLAAGPLEDLLAYHGPSVIAQIEDLANKDSRFRSALFGVWRNTIDAATWERIEKLRREH